MHRNNSFFRPRKTIILGLLTMIFLPLTMCFLPHFDYSRISTTLLHSTIITDNRPHEQRRNTPRSARRLNHPFQHIYRHDVTPQATHLSPYNYLLQYGGYTPTDLQTMSHVFPPLFSLSVERHLKPKLQFLKYTLEGLSSYPQTTLTEEAKKIPPQYYGSRLERVIAPRHAFLMYHSLPSRGTLLQNDCALFNELLLKPKSAARFAASCNSFSSVSKEEKRYTAEEVEAFDILFRRGILSAARNDYPTSLVQTSKINGNVGAEMIGLLLQNGANGFEKDTKGVSLLHWACGAGNEEGAKLFAKLLGVDLRAQRDGATPLHWTVVGVESKQFGTGGNLSLCHWFLEQGGDVNAVTKDGNSVLMWASWAGSLDIVQLLIRYGADLNVRNRNGCTVAHWAASGGNVEVCQYLKKKGVPFVGNVLNYAGNSPLSHAVAYGRTDVIEWLCSMGEDINNVQVAGDLARDFVGWTNGEDEGRKQVLDLFEA